MPRDIQLDKCRYLRGEQVGGMNMSMRRMNMSSQLRKAMKRSRLSGYRISKLTGVGEGSISRFLSGKSGLSMQAIDKIWMLLGLELAGTRKESHGRTDA